MALTQHYRREGTVISAVSTFRFNCTRSGPGNPRHPACSQDLRRRELCPGLSPKQGLPISFFLNRDDTVTVKVIDADGNAVRTLAAQVPLRGNSRHCFAWDGRDDEGEPVRRHRFRLLVALREADREAVAGEPIVLRRSPAGRP